MNTTPFILTKEQQREEVETIDRSIFIDERTKVNVCISMPLTIKYGFGIVGNNQFYLN